MTPASRARPPFVAVAFVIGAIVATSAAAQHPTEIAAVDSIFATFTRETPGCAVGAARNGMPLFQRAYGLASLELGVPLDTATLFDIGSVSKQFTAAIVVMLAEEGRLSLDDPVRRYVPELPSWTEPVTLRHLLNQTSGVRDYIYLLPLAGTQYTAVATTADALAMLQRQRALDFEPVDEFAYSNSNYVLLAQVIERVSHDSLAAVLRRRIFEPVGMRSTTLWTSHAQVVPRRASSYVPSASGDGFETDVFNWETTGDGAIQSTVGDMLHWGDALMRGAVGGPRLWTQLTTRPTLNDGATSPYAMGFFEIPLRGMRRIEHNGVAAGFRADLSLFPDERVVIVLLCNHGGVVPTALAQRVADVLLPPHSDATVASSAAGDTRTGEPPPRVAHPERYTGVYFSPSTGVIVRLLEQDGAIRVSSGGPGRPLRMTKPGEFLVTGTPFVLAVRDSDGTRVLEQRRDGAPTTRFVSVPDTIRLDPSARARYVGRYWSEELATAWDVGTTDSSLTVRLEGVGSVAEPVPQQFRDGFGGRRFVMRFDRDATGAVSGFRIWTRGTRGIAFRRVPAEVPRAPDR